MRRAAAMGLGASAVAAALASRPAPSAFAQDAAPEPSAPRADGTPAPDDQQVLRMVTPSPFRMDPPTYGGDLWQLQMMVYQGLTRVETDGTLVAGHRGQLGELAGRDRLDLHAQPERACSPTAPRSPPKR